MFDGKHVEDEPKGCWFIKLYAFLSQKLFIQQNKVSPSVAMFPSPCFYVHFEVSHQKLVMEMPNLAKKSL